MISTELRDELHQQLLQQRQRLEDEIADLSGTGSRSDVFLEDETDSVDQHPADDASELFEREKNLTLQQTLEQTLQEVNEALRKMDQGTYGICDNCGEQIPEKRLRALPEATRCITCQSKLDRQRS